jgi:high-affinity iron transporter
MGLPIIITFRECLEMLLIIVPLLVYLSKIDRRDLSKNIFLGCGAGALTSIFTAIFLFGQVEKMQGYVQQMFLGFTMIFLAALILYSIVWVSSQNKKLTLDITEKYDIKLTGFSLFLLSFVTIFRESLEIIMFLLPIATQSPIMIISGISIGILCALALSYIIFKTSLKLNVYIIFSALTLILIFIGGRLLGEGMAIILPQVKSVEMLGSFIYIIPLLFIFLKKELRKYLKK